VRALAALISRSAAVGALARQKAAAASASNQ